MNSRDLVIEELTAKRTWEEREKGRKFWIANCEFIYSECSRSCEWSLTMNAWLWAINALLKPWSCAWSMQKFIHFTTEFWIDISAGNASISYMSIWSTVVLTWKKIQLAKLSSENKISRIELLGFWTFWFHFILSVSVL